MAVNGCSESLESHRVMGVSQLSCPEHRATREGMPWRSTYPCVLVSKTGPLRGSLTSKREWVTPTMMLLFLPHINFPPAFPLQPPMSSVTLGPSVIMRLRSCLKLEFLSMHLHNHSLRSSLLQTHPRLKFRV